MKPRRTPRSTQTLGLEGGNEDNDLWVRYAEEDGLALFESVWELTDGERQHISEGANVQLTVFGRAHPPVHLAVVDTPLGKDGTGTSVHPDALGRCSRCLRLTWDPASISQRCRMTQPDKTICGGVFERLGEGT